MDRRRINQRGLSLLELLVVLAVLALGSAIVVLNAPPSRSAARAEAERFAARVAAGYSDAVVRGAPARVRIDAASYAFERYDGEAWTLAQNAKLFGSRTMPEGVFLAATPSDGAIANRREDDKEDDDAQFIVIDPLGAGEAFEVRFSDGREVWRVDVDAAGKLEVGRDDEA